MLHSLTFHHASQLHPGTTAGVTTSGQELLRLQISQLQTCTIMFTRGKSMTEHKPIGATTVFLTSIISTIQDELLKITMLHLFLKHSARRILTGRVSQTLSCLDRNTHIQTSINATSLTPLFIKLPSLITRDVMTSKDSSGLRQPILRQLLLLSSLLNRRLISKKC